MEELRTEDFETSAERCAELRLDRSVVTRIDELGHTAQIAFAVGPSRTEVKWEGGGGGGARRGRPSTDRRVCPVVKPVWATGC